MFSIYYKNPDDRYELYRASTLGTATFWYGTSLPLGDVLVGEDKAYINCQRCTANNCSRCNSLWTFTYSSGAVFEYTLPFPVVSMYGEVGGNLLFTGKNFLMNFLILKPLIQLSMLGILQWKIILNSYLML